MAVSSDPVVNLHHSINELFVILLYIYVLIIIFIRWLSPSSAKSTFLISSITAIWNKPNPTSRNLSRKIPKSKILLLKLLSYASETIKQAHRLKPQPCISIEKWYFILCLIYFKQKSFHKAFIKPYFLRVSIALKIMWRIGAKISSKIN